MINVLSNIRELLGKVGSAATLPGSISKALLARCESLVQNNSLWCNILVWFYKK